MTSRLLALAGLLAGLAGGLLPAHAAEPDSLSRLEASRVLRVCIWPDYYGISYRNPKTQQLSGIDVDNAREVGREMGLSVQFVDSSFASLVDDLLGRRCDVAMFAIGITAQRQEKLRFTQPHLASDIYAISTKSNRRIQRWEDIDRPGSVVVVAKGTLHEPVMKHVWWRPSCGWWTRLRRASRKCSPGGRMCS
jgi:ABC-type amino acid transport substrate-binding protein